MTTGARHRRILQLLENEGNVKVDNLSERFAVSQVTIRKDLAELEEQGLLQRTYGGAVYSHRSRINVSFLEKLQIEAPAKDAIAQLALNYIHEGDTIILDAGSTTLSLARALQGKLRSLYVITNSIPAALELSRAGVRNSAHWRPGAKSQSRADWSCSRKDVGEFSCRSCLSWDLRHQLVARAQHAQPA